MTFIHKHAILKHSKYAVSMTCTKQSIVRRREINFYVPIFVTRLAQTFRKKECYCSYWKVSNVFWFFWFQGILSRHFVRVHERFTAKGTLSLWYISNEKTELWTPSFRSPCFIVFSVKYFAHEQDETTVKKRFIWPVSRIVCSYV